MRKEKTEVRSKKSDGRTRFGVQTVLICLLSSAFCPLAAFGSDTWEGVDKTVVEKIAKEHGREAREPLLNTDQGDLLLFLFLLAGAAGGFAAGYYWRMLVAEKQNRSPRRREGREGNPDNL